MLLLWLACETAKDSNPVTNESCGDCTVDTADTSVDDSPTDTVVDSQDSSVDSSPDSEDSSVDSQPDTQTDTATDSDTGTVAIRAPKILLFIGDGMGFQHVDGGSIYEFGAKGLSSMETLPEHGRLRTASPSGLTDSAASATAMATGVKTWNGYLGMDRDKNSLTNIRELAAGMGLSTGIVTSDTLTGATPAAFLAHVDSRGDAATIAAQIALNPPDVLLGGGRSALEGPLSTFNANFVYDAPSLAAWVDDGRPLVGLFATSTFPFVKDADPNVPSLADMTQAAVQKLSTDPDGFFIMVEGARIDHASHSNDASAVYPEVMDFDQAIAWAINWAATQNDVTILVTADHECGGLSFTGGAVGTAPTSSWRWGGHSNADVPVYGSGTGASVFNGQRLDNTWIYAAMEAALTNTAPVDPNPGLLPDGYIDDLGAPATTQVWPSSYTAGYNQLDGMRIYSDTEGLWIGIDGVFEYGDNTVAVMMDLDYGDNTGVGRDATLSDTTDALDSVLTTVKITPGIDGLGFDAAVASIGTDYIALESLDGEVGLRGLATPFGDPANLWWLEGAFSFDDGNVSNLPSAGSGPAADAAATGATLDGMEVWIPWGSLYPTGLPAAGTTIAFTAVLMNKDGSDISNQTLPPLPATDAIGSDTLTVESVVVMDVAADGTMASVPVVTP